MIRITTLNCNGIRAAQRKGFFAWLAELGPDVICLQETKAHEHQLQAKPDFYPAGYHCYYFDALKKGYAGTAIYSRQQPDRVQRGFGWAPADEEGRYLQVDFGALSVVSLYLPSGSSGEHRQAIKFAFLEQLEQQLRDMLASGREFILCGDWNICHREIDLKNWRANRRNTGFLPEERAWLDHVYDNLGFRDAFRLVDPREQQYTWWSSRGRARENNVGWRLDYHVVTPGLVGRVGAVEIHTEQQFSDHAPVTQAFDWKFKNSGGAVDAADAEESGK